MKVALMISFFIAASVNASEIRCQSHERLHYEGSFYEGGANPPEGHVMGTETWSRRQRVIATREILNMQESPWNPAIEVETSNHRVIDTRVENGRRITRYTERVTLRRADGSLAARRERVACTSNTSENPIP